MMLWNVLWGLSIWASTGASRTLGEPGRATQAGSVGGSGASIPFNQCKGRPASLSEPN